MQMERRQSISLLHIAFFPGCGGSSLWQLSNDLATESGTRHPRWGRLSIWGRKIQFNPVKLVQKEQGYFGLSLKKFVKNKNK
jgi:hypothetical protein